MKNMKSYVGMIALAFGLLAMAEDSTAPAAASVESALVPAETGALQVSIEVRPSVVVESVDNDARMPKYYTENTINFGYQFNSKVYAGYHQGFDANFHSFKDESRRLNPTISDSYIRVMIKDIWSNTSGTSLSYEPRIYLPLAQNLRDAGNIAAIRNYVTLSQKVTSSVSVSLVEMPIFHVYNVSGSVVDGKSNANPVLENRVYLVTSVSLTDKLSLDIPIMVNSIRRANYAGAENSGRLEHTLGIYPELDYAINKTWTVGMAYFSNKLLKYNNGGDLDGLNLSGVLEKGVSAQFVVRASL